MHLTLCCFFRSASSNYPFTLLVVNIVDCRQCLPLSWLYYRLCFRLGEKNRFSSNLPMIIDTFGPNLDQALSTMMFKEFNNVAHFVIQGSTIVRGVQPQGMTIEDDNFMKGLQQPQRIASSRKAVTLGKGPRHVDKGMN